MPQVLDQDIADGMNQLLQGVMTSGTGARAQIGRPAAGKTGTTNRRVSVWFVGYTPDLATAVWAGNPSPPAGGYPLFRTASSAAATTATSAVAVSPGRSGATMMSRTLANIPVSTFSEPTDDVIKGDSVQVPSVSGMSVDQAKQVLRQAGLDPVVSGDTVYADYAAAGTVAYSYPGNGSAVYPGQRVVIYVSAGPPPAQPTSEPGTTLGPGRDCGNSNRPECRDWP